MQYSLTQDLVEFIMSLTTWFIVGLVLARATADEEYKLPEYIKVCYRDDPKINNCLKNVIQKLVPFFKSGSSDFDLEPLDPMYYDNITFTHSSRFLGGVISVTDVKVFRFSTIQVKAVRSKLRVPSVMELEFDAHYDQLDCTGKYEVVGNVARIPINVDGNFNINFRNVNFTYILSGETISRNGSEFMELKQFWLKTLGDGIESVKLVTSDLIRGSPSLSQFAIRFLNQFWKPIFNEMLPVLNPTIDRLTREKLNHIFLKYPYDIIMPKRTRKL